MSAAKKPSENSDEFPIVAIGASAGGFEAFSKLLHKLPADAGMAYVFVQHLDPTHESIVSELLSKATKMSVCEAEEGMRIEVNHVYIMPPNKTITIVDWSSEALGKRGARPAYAD